MNQEQPITIKGVETIARLAGNQDSGEAVLLIHGNPGPSDDWTSVLSSIGTFARAVAPDMPFYGRANRCCDFDCTIDNYASFIEELVNQLDIQKVHLVLHDFGGPWGLAWACQSPDKVASVTLVGTGIFPGWKWHKFAKIWRTPILGEAFQLLSSRKVLGIALNGDNPKSLPDEFIDRIAGYSDWPQKKAVLKLYRENSESRISELAQRFQEQLAPHRIPANVIWGEADPYVPVKHAQAQQNVFDVAGTHIMPGCGHWPMIDNPEEFRNLLVPFLQKQTGSPQF
ncbi:alpha/beta fold hydrolase [Alcanivorax jadensis]|uniref:alpha/beta fold hydrolase n=1 Tax=Alcanivorax jadensis TaxID=64988 RepID=UPI0035699F6A